jgi:hypothetical protein
MTSSPKFAGVNVHWAVSSTGITGFGKMVLTGTDHSSDADTETAQDPYGYVVTDVTYNHRETATLEVWFSGSSSPSGALTIVPSDYPQPGDTVTLTDTVNTAISGSNWIAGNASVKRSNTSLAKATVSLRRYAKI